VDGTTFEKIEPAGLEDWLIRLGEELRTKAYRCQAVGDDPKARRRRVAPHSHSQAIDPSVSARRYR